MRPCPKPRPRRRDRLGFPEHEAHEAHTRRGRPISRGAGLGLLLLPVQYTAALRPSTRPSIPSTEAYRFFPGGRESGDFQGSSSSRRCGVALDAEHAGQAMFPAQQAGDRRDGSPAAGGPAVRKEEERHGGNGVGEVDLLGQAAVLDRHRHRHRHHHKVPVDPNGGGPSPLNGHRAVAVAASAGVASSSSCSSSSSSSAALDPPLPPPPPLSAQEADALAAMKALGKEGKWQEAVALLSQLKAHAAAAASASAAAGGRDSHDITPNLTVYNAAISAVSRSGKWDEALGLLEEMRSAGVQPDVMTFTSVISAGSRSGRAAQAEQILDTMRAEGVPPNAATYNAVITGCSSWSPHSPSGGGGGLQRALRLLERMAAEPRPEAQPEALSYTLVLKACGREGRWETALRLLAEMQAKGLEPTVFSFRYALAACSGGSSGSTTTVSGEVIAEEEDRAGAWERCSSLMDGMSRLDIEPDRLCYKYAVDAAAKAGDVDAALELMDSMEACEGFRGAAEYNQIIAACGRRGDWQRAVSTLGRIRRRGSAPDAHSFAMAMQACARSGEPRQAFRLLDELKREGGGVRPNTVVYNTLLALCKGRPLRGGGGVAGGGGAPAVATGTGDRLNGHGGGIMQSVHKVNGGGEGVAATLPDIRTVRTTGVTAAAGVGGGNNEWGDKPEELVGTAVTLLHEMTVGGGGGGECAPDKMSFELVMQACVNAGRPESALKVFRAMTRWASGGVKAPVAAGTRRGGRGRGKEQGRGRGRAAGRAVGVRPDRATYRLGLTAAAEAGDGAAAAVLLEEMRDAGMAMDESAYHLAATAFGRAGLWRQGIRLTGMAADDGVALSPSTLTGVLGACAKRSRWREALDLLQQARPVLRQSLSPSPSVGNGGEGEENEGEEESGRGGGGGGAGDRRARKKKRPEGSVVAAYTLAMVACRGAGRHAEGLRVLSMLEEDGGRGDEAFFRVALKCCAKASAEGGGGESGSGEGNCSGAAVADRVLGDMSAQGIQCRVEGFTDVAQAYGLAGRWEDALALLSRAAAAAAEDEGKPGGATAPDERMYCSVINAMGECGAWEAAVELVQSMRRSPSLPPQGQLLAAAGGGDDTAGSAAGTGEGPQPGRSAYACACRACARQGEWGAVLALIEDMREDGVARDASVYASAMRAFVEAGEWERAVEIVTVQMERDEVPPDAISYSQALRACRAGADGGGRAAQLALALIAEVRRRGLGPDVVTLEGAARACLADGRPELGLAVVSEALESWRQGSLGGGEVEGEDARPSGGTVSDVHRWSPEEVQRLETLRILLLGRMGRWEESLHVLDAMRAKFGDDLDERAFVSAAHACAAAGEWALVQVVQSEAAAAAAAGDGVGGVSPGVEWDMQRALLSGLATAGSWKRAVAVLREMYGGQRGEAGEAVVGNGDDAVVLPGRERERGVVDPSLHWRRRMLKDYRTVMHACLRAGAWEEALSVWSELRAQPTAPAPCARSYAAALRACGALGRWSTARDLLSEMRAAGGELSPEPRHYAYAVSAAAVADDRAFDEQVALSGQGWGDGSADAPPPPGGEEERAQDGDSCGGGRGSGVREGDTALGFVLSEMALDGAELGWEAYAAVCWARSRRKQWDRASLGVLKLIGERGLGEDADDGAAARAFNRQEQQQHQHHQQQQQQQQRFEGMRSLYGRLLAAAGKIPTAAGGGRTGAAGHAVRQVLADAEERLAPLPGGPGPQVLATAAIAFARAGDWEGARDVALRFSTGGDVGAVGGADLPAAAAAAAAATSAISAAITACARTGELAEAETLAELAGEIESASSATGEGVGGASSGDGKEHGLLGFGQEAGLALAVAYERAGRFSDAEALRSRMQGRLASSLGLEEAAGVEGRGRAGGDGRGAAKLPSVGGRRELASVLEGKGTTSGRGLVEAPAAPAAAGGGDEEYELFLRWMATGEEGGDDEGEEGIDETGGAWLSDHLAAEDQEEAAAAAAAGSGDGAPTGWEEGLTIRELEGW